jgi:hypothetical protein
MTRLYLEEGGLMSSRYDEVAKAVAKNVPRRKLLKVLAGGAVAAATGSALTGSATAKGYQSGPLNWIPPFSGLCEPEMNETSLEVNGNFVEQLRAFDCEVVIPWWNQFYQRIFGFEVNGNPG